MTDPEIEHRRLVSGDAASVRGVVDALDGVLHTMVGVRQDLAAAAEVPVWSGTGRDGVRRPGRGPAAGTGG